MTKDEFYMNRCLELAKKALGKTYPNPLVGSVIVHQDRIIGEGYHHKAGENHAEINAIKSVKNPDLLQESTIYVSLEPCSHFGKTPPCANKIVELGFKKVVIGTLDSHEKVNGKGKQIIESAGIEVVSGVLEKQCKELNKRFFTFHQKKRPFIILKWAQSADGFIDDHFQPAQIGNALTKQFVHQIRSEENAILVGTATALNDNPSLTTREITGRNPIRILIDFDLKVPINNHIFDDAAKTLIFNTQKNESSKNLQFIKTERKDFLPQLMPILYEMQIQSVLVEGGRQTLEHFIQANLWDEALVISNGNLFFTNGTKSPSFFANPFCTKNFGDNQISFFNNY